MVAEPDPADRLRAAGLRNTRQRRAVLSALSALEHATPEELAAQVRAQDPDLNLSTVYRTLDVLARARLVTHVHLHHGSTTYHSTDGEAHLHLVCTNCGVVSQQPLAVAGGLAARIHSGTGFEVDLTHLVLHGLCATCSGTRRASASLEQP